MTIFDSNIWIAYLNKDDSQHRRATSYFSRLDDELLITEYIILEVVTVLAMRVDKDLADNFLDLVLNNTDVQVLKSSSDFFDSSVNAFQKYKKDNLSFVDISLLKLARDYKVSTFDEDLKKEIRKLGN